MTSLCLKQYLKMTSHRFSENLYPGKRRPRNRASGGQSAFRRCEGPGQPHCHAGSGCRVYPARPASCRTYPLARGVSRDRQTGALTEHWALIREPHCKGFEGRAVLSPSSSGWTTSRSPTHNRMNDRMLELIGTEKPFSPGGAAPFPKKSLFTRPFTTWTPFVAKSTKRLPICPPPAFRSAIFPTTSICSVSLWTGLGRRCSKAVLRKPNFSGK